MDFSRESRTVRCCGQAPELIDKAYEASAADDVVGKVFRAGNRVKLQLGHNAQPEYRIENTMSLYLRPRLAASVLSSAKFSRSAARGRGAKVHRRKWLACESLEDRRLLAVAAGAELPEFFDTSTALFVENQGQWTDSDVRYGYQADGVQDRFCRSAIRLHVMAARSGGT